MGMKMPKVERYKWKSSEPGSFQLLSKHDLAVDHTYQRDTLRRSTVDRIKRDWNWAAFGSLTVADAGPEKGQRYLICDGQHRHSAAMARDDIDHLPCMVFKKITASDQAAAFLDINGGRVPVSSMEKHKARLVIGERASKEAQELLDQAGWKAANGPSPNGFRPVNVLTVFMNNANTNRAVRGLWPILVGLHVPTKETVLQGLVHMEMNLANGQSLTIKPWSDRLLSLGHDKLHDAAKRAAALYIKGGARVWALGMLDVINKGMRTNRLVMKGPDNGEQA